MKSYQDLIRIFPDFPIKGINFIDWMPIMNDTAKFEALIDELCEIVKGKGYTKILGLESRGFLLGLPMAQKLGIGFAPIRKKGKLAGPCLTQEYELEYGTSAIEIQVDAIHKDDKVLIVDDLLATGGTMEAANQLVKSITPNIFDLFFIELTDIEGYKKLTCPYISVLKMKEK